MGELLKRKRRHERTPTTHAPTPIVISPPVKVLLIVLAAAALLLVMYHAPSLLTLTLGGVALAVVLSFPVRLLSRVMPRGLAILISFVVVIGITLLALIGVVPVLIEQLVRWSMPYPGLWRASALDCRRC